MRLRMIAEGRLRLLREDLESEDDSPYMQWHNWLSELYREARQSPAPDVAIPQFYVDLWDTHRENADPQAFKEISEFVAGKIKKFFGLSQFFPTNYLDYQDGWVLRPPGSRMTTGRVREILRPGLQDDQGNLRIPAVCRVE